jgi:alkylhydroperoxidase family enzyme
MAAGESSQRWSNLVDGDQSQWSAAERAALEFAVAMTLESDVYPDAKFDDLVRQFSPEIVGSMVLHMAFANFQDRLAICLEVAQSDKPVLPPVEVAFDIKGLAEASSAPSSAPSTTNDSADKTKADTTIEKTASQEHIAPSELIWLDYQGLQGRLTDQRNRKSRLVSPPWSQVVKRLPPGLMDKPSDITWYQLSMGYAPELAVPFEYYLEIAGGEVLQDWDRVFGGSLFWMVTNSIHCPYCMGHCEMNWEVAGLKSGDIADLSKRLAENEWSEFNPPQQNALLFARKLTQAPEQVSKEDIQQLERDWGKARAIRIALQCSRYNYMVRISNGFQLQLESENVFWDYYGMPKPKDDQQSR